MSQMLKAPYLGRYINLDRSLERRSRLEAQFAALGCADRYQRFAAIDGATAALDDRASISPGELGCFRSHQQCVQETADAGWPTHIVEDDVVFAASTVAILDQIVDEALTHWDVLFLDIIVPFHFNTLFNLLGLYRRTGLSEAGRTERRTPSVVHYLDLREIPFSGASSYLISPSAAAKLSPLIAAAHERGPTLPIDSLYQHLTSTGQITAACAVPFITSVDAGQVMATTLSGRVQAPLSAMALFLLRSYFFVDKDMAEQQRIAEALSLGSADDADLEFLWPALRHMLGDRFQNL